MRSKYLVLGLVILLFVIIGVNATNEYSIPVGTHEVKFNTSSSSFEDQYVKTIYTPVYPGNSGLDYTHSETTLWPESGGPFLTITARDFKRPIPSSAYFNEESTLSEFWMYLPLRNYSTHYLGNRHVIGVAFDYENEVIGSLMAWPSDQVEIIVTGRLPSIDIWKDIADSLELVR